jgi:DNA repair protein RadA/Sms
MARTRTQYVCQNCGDKAAKWQGKCDACGQWNTFVEEVVEKVKSEERGRKLSQPSEAAKPLALPEIEVEEGFRLKTGMHEFDRVLGGGIVPGETVMIGGDPGIGKSTLLLQVVDRLSKLQKEGQGKCLYVTGEESAQQIKLRAERLGIRSNNLYIFPETDVATILAQIEKTRPVLTVIDSIQTLFLSEIASAPGSVSQVRESAARLTYLAKREKLPLFLIGHVTKEGSIAGPMVLEHMVDAVLYFEGDLQRHYRLLRAVKNRFGSTQEIGIFEMRDSGLAEVADASRAFLEDHYSHHSGSVITAGLEGTRPLLLEVQSLVSPGRLPERGGWHQGGRTLGGPGGGGGRRFLFPRQAGGSQDLGLGGTRTLRGGKSDLPDRSAVGRGRAPGVRGGGHPLRQPEGGLDAARGEVGGPGREDPVRSHRDALAGLNHRP